MVRYENNTFRNQTITIDGNSYHGCNFVKCKIVYSGGALPNLAHNSFIDCQVEFDDAAKRTLALMTLMYNGGFQGLVESTFEEIRQSGGKAD